MSTLGPLGPGQCVEEGLSGLSDLLTSTSSLYNTDQFVNPQLTNILNMAQSSTNGEQRAEAWILGLSTIQPPPPNLTEMLGYYETYKTSVAHYQSTVEQYQIWTNFLSGKSPQFPLGGPSGLNTELLFSGNPPVGLGLLLGMGFVGVMGAVASGNQSLYAQCELDPDDPCAAINKIFGSIMGAVNTVINAMIAGFNMMTDFASKILDYIAQVTAFAEQMIAIVAEAVAELANMLVKALIAGFGALLDALKLNPCMKAVMGHICGPQLTDALKL
jgi:hypothetical protein